MTAASAAGTPVAVNTGGVTTAAALGASVALVGAAAFLGAVEHPLSAREPARSADTPRKTAERDDGRKR